MMIFLYVFLSFPFLKVTDTISSSSMYAGFDIEREVALLHLENFHALLIVL